MSFCKNTNTFIRKNSKSLPEADTRDLTKKVFREKTHAFTCPEGSYTLEAVIILPLVAAFWVFILFFSRVMQVETGVQEALFYAGRKTAIEASVTDSSAALGALAVANFQKEVRQYDQAAEYISGGTAGISLLGSDFSSDYITLHARYTLKLPFRFFTITGISIQQNCSARKWTGRDVEEEKEDPYVYVAEYGSVYHLSENCSYLKLKISSTSVSAIAGLRNKSGGIYYPCSGCGAGSMTTGTVYYTPYGTNYHKSLTCSGIKRTVHMVRLSQVGGLRACSKCGGG